MTQPSTHLNGLLRSRTPYRDTDIGLALALRREQALGRLRDHVLDDPGYDELVHLIEVEFLQELCNLGVRADSVSMRFPGDDETCFRSHRGLFEDIEPWIQQAWRSGEPQVVSHNNFASGTAKSVRTHLEYPVQGGGSVGIDSSVEDAFDDQAIQTVGGLAGILGVAARRVADLDKLRGARQDLEARVLARTRDLQKANEALQQEVAKRHWRERRNICLKQIEAQVWKMGSAEDIVHVMHEVRQTLQELEVPFSGLSVHLVEQQEGRLSFRTHDLTLTGSWHELTFNGAIESHRMMLQIWREQKPLYRSDLAREDPYNEYDKLSGQGVRSVVDVPFEQGVLGVSSQQPEAFTEQLIQLAAAVALALEEGFRRCDDLRALALVQEQYLQSQRMEAIGRLAGGIAHDFNNLLTAINGNAELLSEFVDPVTQANYVRPISDAGARAAALVGQLLTFSRQQSIDLHVVDVNDVVRNLENLLGTLIGEDVELAIELEDDAGHIHSNPSQLEQVVMNLVVNARDAMPQGGRITITTESAVINDDDMHRHFEGAPGHYAMICVSDNGEGMDRETQQRMFEPFFTTKSLNRGTGLGLSTVYGIVRQCGGHVWVYSELGHGTTFRLYFPRTEDAGTEGPTESQQGSAGGEEVILLVEDEPLVRNYASHVLTQLGYHVVAAASPEEGLRKANSMTALDMVLSDVVMPQMNGPQMVEQLRQTHPGCAILFISGYADSALHMGGDLPGELLAKPFDGVTLGRHVRRALDERAAHSN